MVSSEGNREFEKVQVLDCGYVQLIETWGSDERIVEAARMSTNKGFLGWGEPDCIVQVFSSRICEKGLQSCIAKHTGDEKLLRYLYEHAHHTPFEMAGMVIEVQAPIMVFREWHRHRTQSYNELSARYTPLPNVNYMPDSQDIWRRANAPTKNKQAAGVAGEINVPLADIKDWMGNLQKVYELAQAVYEDGLKIGIPKELARLPVPVARYSRMRAQANLRNWLAFMTLRMAPDAQYEIRAFANEVGNLVKKSFPRTYELFEEKFQNVQG